MESALDVPACVIVPSHIDDREILSQYFALGLHHSGQLLLGGRGFFVISTAHPSGERTGMSDRDGLMRI